MTEGDTSAWAQELLELLRPAGRDVRKVVDWLAATVDANVSLRDDTGTLLAGPATLPDRSLPDGSLSEGSLSGESLPDESLAADVVTGRIASAAWQGRGRHLRLVRIELQRRSSAALLTVDRAAPFDRRASEIVTHTAAVLEVLLRARRTTTTVRRLQRAAADLRLAILQLLMVEDTVSARRVAAGLWPGLLDTDTAGVYVLEGRTEERDELAERCVEATGEQALVVRCPAMDAHVIVVTPREATGEDLRALIADRAGTYLGGSTRQNLACTATAYGQAVSALAVARFRTDRTAVYAERTHPGRLMDPAALRAWTSALLRPLDTLAHHTSAELLATTRLGLEFTAVNAAKILGVSRNTVRARMERVESLLATDFSALTVRAAVHLALNTQVGLPADGTAARPAPARLDDLLTGPALRTWAQDLLGRLDTDARDLRGSLRAWLAAGGNAERAAQQIGVHAQTVREHVRSAEPVLERRLLTAGSDLYEVVLAHLVTEELDRPALDPQPRQEETGHPDALVHR
ncbi:helix-turn-helix domain-containing protein [Streptomyces sp. NPDC059378]|uniref:helix-turn-helix domain-containing protein n=1 Tax=Streptomyces sp. NPDC059378 TaxID=3346815 RepID=UPI0036B091AD